MSSKSVYVIVLAAFMLLIAGCGAQVANNPVDNPLYNQTLNEDIENTISQNYTDTRLNMNFSFEKHPDAKYDFGLHDIFSLDEASFNSSQYSVLGIKLGDTYEDVLDKLGVPDVMYVPGDKSYRNMEYSRKIGIDDPVTAVSYHLEKEKVTQISMRQNSYFLKGNTSMGQNKAYLYAVLGTPDYQGFSAGYKVFYYVEYGLEIYMNSDDMKIISIKAPRKFLGVEYRSVLVEVSRGVYANVTKPFLVGDNSSQPLE